MESRRITVARQVETHLAGEVGGFVDGGVGGVVVRPGKRGRTRVGAWVLAQGDEAVEGAAGKGKAGSRGPVLPLRGAEVDGEVEGGMECGGSETRGGSGRGRGLHEDSTTRAAQTLFQRPR